MPLRKTIALADWNWEGHHPSFFAHFVVALEQIGFDVLALCAEPDEALQKVIETREMYASQGSFTGRTQFRKIKTQSRRFANLRPARISVIDWTIRHFTSVEKQLLGWGKDVNARIDAIFYACIYDWEFEWVHLAQPFLKIPWTGLYLHASNYRLPENVCNHTGKHYDSAKIFSSKLCKALGTLDEGISEKFSEFVKKPVVAFPDIPNNKLAVSTSGDVLANKLRAFANGKPIVGLFGCLHKRKGMLTFLRAANKSDPEKICFALAGELHWPQDQTERMDLKNMINHVSNLWSHFISIDDGPDFNGLLASSDIIFAAYEDFPQSSNIQTKAALMQKPIIVSDGFLMAERVRRHNLGEVIAQEKPDEILAAINRILSHNENWIEKSKPAWDKFNNQHSFEKLKNSFSELLKFI